MDILSTVHDFRTCKFRANIHASVVHDVTKGEFIEMHTPQKFGEANNQKIIRFLVKKFDEFPGVCSPQFVLNNIPWQIYIFKREERLEDTLRIKLYPKLESIEIWTCDICMDCNLIPFNDSLQPKRKKIEFSFVSNRIDSWDLIKWSEFIDTKNQLIGNNLFKIEVDLKILRV